jgi:hypothetical protein
MSPRRKLHVLKNVPEIQKKIGESRDDDAILAAIDLHEVARFEFTTVSRAALRFGIGVKALRAAIRRGEVRTFGLGTAAGGRPRVLAEEVRRWALSTAIDRHAAARQAGDAAARRAFRS